MCLETLFMIVAAKLVNISFVLRVAFVIFALKLDR